MRIFLLFILYYIGIHVKKLKYVVNYDFPTNLEQYCHRVGRTGRQGEKGGYKIYLLSHSFFFLFYLFFFLINF
jgi:superfamily II DNA/RNA helicase